jgi:hypothetical protein
MTAAVRRTANYSVGSAAVASTHHIAIFYANLEREMNRHSRDDPNGYVNQLIAHRVGFDAAIIPAWDVAHTNPGAAGAPAAPAALVFPATGDPRGKPIWMEQEDYDYYICPPALDAAITAAVAAAPAGPVAYPDPPTDYDRCGPLQEEFDALLWQILLAGGHSGYPTQATFTQCLDFTFKSIPADGDAYCFHLSDLPMFLPSGITFLNIANAHADMIVRTAKESHVVFEWGRRHKVPAAIGYAGVPCWPHVKDTKLVSEDMRETLEYASLAAIRDSQSISFMDPAVAHPERREGVDRAADLLAQRQELLDRSRPNELDPRIRARSRYSRPQYTEEEEALFQDFLRRRRESNR